MDADLTVVISYALASLSCRLPDHRIFLSPRNSLQRASRVRVYVPDSGCEFSGPQYLLKPFEGGFKVPRNFFITHCFCPHLFLGGIMNRPGFCRGSIV